MNIYAHQDSNIAKTWAMMIAFFALVVGIGYLFSYVYDNVVIFYGAIIFSLIMNVGSYWFSDKIVIKMSGARPVVREEYPDLWNITENLAITAGLPMPRLYIMDDAAPNAFATGRDKEHAVVAVTTGLLQALTKPELEGVIAHELSHIGNKDMLLSTVAVVLVGFITLLSDFFLRVSGLRGDRDRKVHPAILIAAIVLAILSPIIATMMRLAISRKREFLADASGALLTRYPEGLASALEKIATSARPMTKANHATAHLFIANPFGPGEEKVGMLTKLFMTHPPIRERVQILRGEK